MEDRLEKALSLHKKGYNCCQAIVCTYADKLNMDESSLFKLSEGFGAGMGNLNGVCGALSGAVMVAGSLNSAGKIVQPLTKSSTYKLISKINHDFEEKVGSLVCKTIKGVGCGTKLRTCDGCVEDAVTILEKHCFTNKE